MKKTEWSNKEMVVPREPARNFRTYDLWRGANGALAQLVEIGPGGCYPTVEKHYPGPEECFVVSGVFNDGVRDYPAGSFIHCPEGSEHVPQSSQGCVLFLFYPEG